jgi:16S rRNA G966 N2-methylase RsmD
MNKEDFEFIKENINNDTTKLLLKYHNDINKRFLINQIGKRQKIKFKLPEFYDNLEFIFPQNSLPIEQCSSEISAKIKAELFKGESFIDLTGGLGIDSYFISKNFNKTYFVEPSFELFNLAKQNYPNFITFNLPAEEFINQNKIDFDLVYIDPDRRDDNNNKLFLLNHLKPNILEILNKINSKQILIKLSPIFEISELKKHFEKYDIILISIDNELKELLVHFHNEAKFNYKIFTIEKDVINEFNYQYSNNNITINNNYYKYLYEPNVAILKANLQNQIANDFKLSKFNINSHLYTSIDKLQNYPGNIYEISQILNYKKSDFKNCKIDSGIIKIKNFGDTLSIIKKKLNIKESNNKYLFFTKDNNNKSICIVCNKLTK